MYTIMHNLNLQFIMGCCLQDLLENGLNAQNFAMLGLGDIVIPGIFIALLLRYDNSLGRKSHFYFYATFLGKQTAIIVISQSYSYSFDQ